LISSAVRQHPPHDVLGQLGPVDAYDGPAALADLLAQRGHPLLDVRPVRALAQELGVRAEAVHTDAGPAGRAAVQVLDRSRRVRGRGHAVALGVDLARAAHEGRRPPPGQERHPVGAEHAVQQLRADVVGEHPEVVLGRPRSVGEVADAQVGAQLAEHPRHQAQVVVLDQHGGAVGGLLGQRLGEGAVVGAVRVPLAPELRVEDRLQRGLVQHVVDEPEHGVGDAVVRVGVHLGVDGQHPYAVLADSAPYGLPVTVAEGGTHP
jgi:hypothetical protein